MGEGSGPIAGEPTSVTRDGKAGLIGAAVLGLVLILAFAVRSAFAGNDDPGEGPALLDAAYVPIDPCRLFDLRPDGVGPRTAPLGPEEVYTQPVVGSVGECVIPEGATSIALHVTITQPTATSYLTVFPGDLTDVPSTSNLNWLAGQAPTSNSVYVKIGPDGDVKFFNSDGEVYVLADVVGYRSAADPNELADHTAREVIPNGVTVTGNVVWSTAAAGPDPAVVRTGIDLPGVAPEALSAGDIAFADSWAGGDERCDGTPENPTAPAGMVCIYPIDWDHIDEAGTSAAPAGLADQGFTIEFVTDGVAGSTAFLEGTWAYRAP